MALLGLALRGPWAAALTLLEAPWLLTRGFTGLASGGATVGGTLVTLARVLCGLQNATAALTLPSQALWAHTRWRHRGPGPAKSG